MAKDRGFYEALNPFISLTLAKTDQVAPGERLERCLKDLETACGNEKTSTATDFTRFEAEKAGGTTFQAMCYKRTLQPSWTSGGGFENVEHHLAIAIARNNHVALHLTDPKLKGPLRAGLLADYDPDIPLSWLSPVPRLLMSAAFLENGQAKTLWLSGIHRRSASKADAKILAGQDLDYSLDPFDDQSFYWSAARSRSAALEITIGVSPRSSRIWVGKAKKFEAFANSTAIVIDSVAKAKVKAEASEPFRFLAVPLEALNPEDVKDGYDLSILPPDMLDDGDDDADIVNRNAALILSANFIADPSAGANLAVTIELNSVALGTLDLEVTIARNGKTKFKVDNRKPTGVDDPVFERLTEILAKGAGINIRYDSGHSISDGQVYKQRAPRIPFTQFADQDFTGFNVKKEKPDNLAKIGGENSLFCWVQKTHGGWLACDDGANEKADFIHLDDSGKVPVLSLIHVKGAKSDKPGRRLSVSAYEVVTGQAVKNLQWLDKQALAEGLSRSARSANYFWKDGKTVAKDDFVAAIEKLGDNFERRVVVLQPHVRTAAKDQAEAAKTGVNRLRVDQLNTLLASAWRSCNGLGAKFEVIWST
ncbi:hypothetical protein ACFB49_22910 [Sphingomonas sp. DBB INV C78]|uniref:hypothetical protein n=1 Tax=Sphingomonas sp. DBB INV C78 TaxID=3349434 RepID=UPI0036D3047A